MTSQIALQALQEKDKTLCWVFQKGVSVAQQADWMEPGRQERLESREEAGQISQGGVVGPGWGGGGGVGTENAPSLPGRHLASEREREKGGGADMLSVSWLGHRLCHPLVM